MSSNKQTIDKLKALKKNDKAVFDELYIQYHNELSSYLLNFTRDTDRIEDVVQDTFMQLWMKRKQIKLTISLKSYLYKMAYNKLIDNFRTIEKTNKMLASYYYTAVNLAEELDNNHKNMLLDKLEYCIEKLPKRCKNVFIAAKLIGKKNKQIAVDLNLSIKTIEGHITTAYKLIKNCVKL